MQNELDNTTPRKWRFIDLFAGIGGFHQAMKIFNTECVFASEKDIHARKTYLANHDIDKVIFNKDIREVVSDEIPDFDILCAGFPCQPFSQAGYKKGFDDGDNSERGNLFYNILEILEDKQPPAFILENVRHLLKHDEGHTFAIIKESLEQANYTIYYKILKASEYGRPQHRARIFIVGFHNAKVKQEREFKFPLPKSLKMTMSDVWEGECNKVIGFTLRVGGKSSPLDDRRNWDGYLVDGEERRIGPKQAIKMLGFPDDFVFPVSTTQAMKQLGNSVCIDVVEEVAKEVFDYLEENLQGEDYMAKGKNRGEWSELYTTLKIIENNYIPFGDVDKQSIESGIEVFSVQPNNSKNFYGIDKEKLIIKNDNQENILNRDKVIEIIKNKDVLGQIKRGEGAAFDLEDIEEMLDLLNFNFTKASSYKKADIYLGFLAENIRYNSEPIGIKSYVASAPTLLNASRATNFIFRLKRITECGQEIDIDAINKIDSEKKLRDRILKIRESGYELEFLRCEKPLYQDNLRKVDSLMPEFLARMLKKFYSGEGARISDLVSEEQEVIRIKDFLKSTMLGIFPTKIWDGNYTANGSMIVRKDGELLIYHVVKDSLLKDYLFYQTKMETGSSSRHGYGLLYKEGKEIHIKLNLQIRFI